MPFVNSIRSHCSSTSTLPPFGHARLLRCGCWVVLWCRNHFPRIWWASSSWQDRLPRIQVKEKLLRVRRVKLEGYDQKAEPNYLECRFLTFHASSSRRPSGSHFLPTKRANLLKLSVHVQQWGRFVLAVTPIPRSLALALSCLFFYWLMITIKNNACVFDMLQRSAPCRARVHQTARIDMHK